jgi:methionyl aminopeptidase
VNNEVIHGIPSRQRVLKDGDIVSIDIGACLNGFHGDTCATFGVGTISKQAQRLLDVTRDSLYAGIAAVKEGCRIGDIARTVQEYCESHGFFVVKSFCGHGIGRRLHEDPEIPNFGKKGRGVRLSSGMTIAIEPMVNEGGEKVDILADGTVVNSCGGLSAHFEHSVAVLPDGCALLTQLRDG